jgi:hypothetical protein
MTYDTWKAHNPADDELGSRSQPGQEHEPTPGTEMSTISTDLAILLGECIAEKQELRELNAELLAALKDLLLLAESQCQEIDDELAIARAAIAKAEALK